MIKRETLELLKNIIVFEDEKEYAKNIEMLYSDYENEDIRILVKNDILKALKYDTRLVVGMNEHTQKEFEEFCKNAEANGIDFEDFVVKSNIYAKEAVQSLYLDETKASLDRFAGKYGFESIKGLLSNIDGNSSFLSKKAFISSAITEVYAEVKEKIELSDIEITDKIKNEIMDLGAGVSYIASLSKVSTGDVNDLGVYSCTCDFIDYAEELLEKYTKVEINKEKEVNTMTDKKVDNVSIDDLKKLKNIFVEEIDEDENKFVIDKKPMEGSIENKELFENLKSGKFIKLGCGTIVVLLALSFGSYLAINEFSNRDETHDDKTQNEISQDQNKPWTEMSSAEKNVKITEIASSLYDNWNEDEQKYTVDDIKQVIYALNGLDSKLSIEEVDDVLIDIINDKTTDAINMGLVKKEYQIDKTVELTDLFLEKKTGYEAVENMEIYLNKVIASSKNSQKLVKDIYKEEIKLAVLGETVDEFNLSDEKISPEYKLLWSRLVLGVNGIIGTEGDMSITVNGKTYTANEINDFDVYNNIAKEAKQNISGTTYSK